MRLRFGRLQTRPKTTHGGHESFGSTIASKGTYRVSTRLERRGWGMGEGGRRVGTGDGGATAKVR